MLADLKPFFKDNFLRKLDTDVLLASTVYRKVQTTAKTLNSVVTTQTDEFIEKIYMDQFGNLNGRFKLKGEEHTIRFNWQSRGRRNLPQDELVQQIKEKLIDVFPKH